MTQKRIRDYGIKIGPFETGPLNRITDIKGVRVGHYTVDNEDHKTGVTVILPCEDNPFSSKLTAAAYVHNGFGKTAGTLQIEELGTLETPIALTNTLNVGLVHDAIVSYMVDRCEKDKVKMTSLNPVVGECNDASLNKITERVIGEKEVMEAIRNATREFEEGDVGAGKGTTCFGMKGGIGSSSRILEFGGKTYTIGALVQSNFGKTANFILDGKHLGSMLCEKIEEAKLDQGSIMMVIGTDIPLSSRQLKRVIRRASAGLARCGSIFGHGSGDIMLGFTTANRIPMETEEDFVPCSILAENKIDSVFEACGDAIEEAVLNSLAAAHTVTGYEGTTRYSLTDLYLKDL